MDTGGVNLEWCSAFQSASKILTWLGMCSSRASAFWDPVAHQTKNVYFLLLMVCRAASVHFFQRWNWVTGAPTTPVCGQAERPAPWAGRGIRGILLWVWAPAQHLCFRRISTRSAELGHTGGGLVGLPGYGSHRSTFIVQILTTKPRGPKPLLCGAK